MPAWTTHLVTANKVLEKIDIEDKNSFIFGNILPDVNNGYFVTNVTNVLNHKKTHFTTEEDIKDNKFNFNNIQRFIEEYKDDISNPLLLGYLVHMLTDSYWNQIAHNEHYIYSKDNKFEGCKLLDDNIIKCARIKAIRIKQKDFNVFGDFLLKENKIMLPKYDDNLLKYSNIIKENPITKQDIIDTIDYLNKMMEDSKLDESYKYQMFTKDELINKFDKSIEFAVKSILPEELKK